MKLRVRGRNRGTAAVVMSVAVLIGCGGDDAPEAAEYAAVSDEPVASASTRTPPPASEPVDATADDVALERALADDPNLTVFGRLIETARLESELAREGELTLFVPNNAAFALIPEGEVAGEARAREFVLRHIVSGSYDSEALAPQRSVRSLGGSSIALRTEDGALVVGEGARVVTPDRRLGNLTIHVISRVLPGS